MQPVPLLALLLAAAGLLTAASASAQTAEVQTITVSGQGVVSAPPDRAVIRLGVQTVAPTAAQALRQNEDDVARVLGRVRSFGVADRQIQIDALQLGEDYQRRTEDGPQGYRAYRVVSVTLDSLRAVPDLVASVVESGANRLDGIDYTLRSAVGYRDQALDEAVADARRKAERLAAAAGATVGAVLAIQEQGLGVVRPSPSGRAARPDAVAVEAEPGAYSAGSSEVRAGVVVQYQLVTR